MPTDQDARLFKHDYTFTVPAGGNVGGGVVDAETYGGTGIVIKTEGGTAPGEAMALLRSVIGKFDVDAFEFDFDGDGIPGRVHMDDLVCVKTVDSSSSILLIEASVDISGGDTLTETVAEINVDGLNFQETSAELFKALTTLVPEDGFDLVP